MQDVPKIVRERLRAATPAVNHPDAEVLTAFSERSLPALERDIVLEHLARCVECRDIVALALPVSEPVATAVKTTSTGWLTWPALRWGFVAAGIVAIASFGVRQYQRHDRRSMLADKVSVPQAVTEARNDTVPASREPAKEEDKLQPAPASPSAVNGAKAAPGVSTPIARAEAPALNMPQIGGGSGAGLRRGMFPHGPKVAIQQNGLQQNAQQNSNNFFSQGPAASPTLSSSANQHPSDLSANERVPSASQTVEVESQANQIKTEAQNLDSALVLPKQLPQPSAGDGYAQANVERAKPAEASGVKVLAKSSPPQPPAYSAGRPLSPPQWTINSAGGLQRSFDQGNTWQDVSVNGASAVAGAAATLEVASKMSREKESDNRIDKKDKAEKKESAPFTFRAVAANGADVWAGGSSGLLYHSTDAGAHWTRVIPSAAGATLAGDIVSLEFADAQHGKISTSTAEVWITTDAGQSWEKQ